ncbi:MAG: isocitrate/isopropylmalate dehydrogenase family protein [Gemmatimonadaceae bacterium]
MNIPCTLIPGDGIGPDITDATLRVLDAVRAAGGVAFEWDRQIAGMAAVKAINDPMPDDTLESIKRTRLALKGPLETPSGGGYRSVNVALRRAFDLYANVRPTKDMIPGGRFDNVDIVLVRENTEGLYAGLEHYIKIGTDEKAAAQSIALVTRVGSERVIRFAFEYALKHGRKRLTLVHKANILKYSQGLFREIGQQVATEYQGKIAYDEQIIDAMAMKLVLYPEKFDVLVTTNMFGDILSDLASGLVGGLGLAPGANIGEHAAIFEAVHGTAPDIAGQGIANPGALILAACLMLEHVGDLTSAARVRAALEAVLREGKVLTRDLGGTASTTQFSDYVIGKLESSAIPAAAR